MLYGYARVSSRDQKLDRQIIELEKFGVEEKNIYFDKQSGKDFERQNYQYLKTILKEGDVLIIKSIDRLGRNYNMILEEWASLTKIIKADIVVLDMDLLDTRTSNNLIGKFIADIVLQILSFVAENERINIKQRQAEGIRIAHEKGVEFGRPKRDIPANLREYMIKYRNKKTNLAVVLEETNLKRSTFYKHYKEFIMSLEKSEGKNQ